MQGMLEDWDMLKVELHTHTADDPADLIPHTTEQLIERAADLGYGALAITLHDRQLETRPYEALARRRGIVLIPGVERTIGGKHVLLLNFPSSAERVASFEELADLKAVCHGLVIAPHPFYPAPSCLGRRLQRHAALFDAVEFNAFYTRHLNQFNERAVRWARHHGKPVVANSDVHRLSQLGRTYTLVDARPDPAAICGAIRAGHVEMHTEPFSVAECALLFTSMAIGGVGGRLRRRPGPGLGESGLANAS